jgi:hypothetical protein
MLVCLKHLKGLLGRQPISTKSVDASQYIKNRSMGAACTDLRRQTNLHENTTTKWREMRREAYYFTVLLNTIRWLQRL